MRLVVIQRCSMDATSWGHKNQRNRVARATRIDEITYHTPYRRRRRPFEAGASPLCDACACACNVEENEGNCQ